MIFRSASISILLTAAASAAVVGFFVALPVHASLGDDIANLRAREQELERQIVEYQRQADVAGTQSKTLQSEIAKLNAQIGQINTQISVLTASINRTDLEIQQTQDGITEAERKIALYQQALAEMVRETDAKDREPLAILLLRNAALSDFFDQLQGIQQTQDNLRLTIRSIRELHNELDQQHEVLKERQEDLERLKTFQEIQQRQVASVKSSKNKVLQGTKGEESKFQQLAQKSQRDLARLRDQITYLIQGGLTVEDAVRYAELAAIGAGIRPAFLLALLEVESRLGRNVGTGNWRDDMYECYLRLANYYPSKRAHYINRAETEKSAYFKIMAALGLDPDSQKVSREPTYGCGGAMGPAQFIPSTWLAYTAEITALTGHNPVSPWNFQDAFTASAIKLARGGATSKDRTGETRAAKAYISGSPTCSSATCNSYAATILNKAAQIEQDL